MKQKADSSDGSHRDSIPKLVGEAWKRVSENPVDAVFLTIEHSPDLLHRYLELLCLSSKKASNNPRRPLRQAFHAQIAKAVEAALQNDLVSRGAGRSRIVRQKNVCPVSMLIKSSTSLKVVSKAKES